MPKPKPRKLESDAVLRPQAVDPAAASFSAYLLLPFLRLLDSVPVTVAEAAREQGERLLARWGVSGHELEADTGKRVPYGLLLELNDIFIALLADPAAPLRAGMAQKPGDCELLEYLAASCATLGDAITCVSRYYALMGPAQLELHVIGERAESRFQLTPGLVAPDAFNEFALASNFAMTVWHIQLEGAQMPVEMCFAHAEPAHAPAIASLVPMPVRFGCEHNAIVFPRSMLDHPMARPDPMLHAVLKRLADHELDALTNRGAFPAKVRSEIERQLEQGAALELVADGLHMSPSTLRSRLAQYGTNYTLLLDGLRRDHASRALRQSQLSISEVAHRLGFAHPPAFHRAVKRWFGVTPSEYRDAPSTHPAARLWRKGG